MFETNSSERDHFANYAGVEDIDDALAAELEAAGITVHRFPFLKNGRGEINTAVMGDLHGWNFKRAWCYWVAEGHGIELAAAERLHEAHGKSVRVNGHCGCPSPREQNHGLAVGLYHVDRPSGLKALADTIRGLVERPVVARVPWVVEATHNPGRRGPGYIAVTLGWPDGTESTEFVSERTAALLGYRYEEAAVA